MQISKKQLQRASFLTGSSAVLAIAVACSSSSFSGQGNTGPIKGSANGQPHAACSKKNATNPSKKSLGLNGSSASCTIDPNGDQARLGVYAVVLTYPAPCDFKLPTVTISSSGLFGGDSVKVPVGTYWSGLTGTTAHSFGLTGAPANAPRIDNGFLLIQPDGKSYLLADGGMALPMMPTHQSASDIANQVSQSLGFGPTELLKPDPGSETDNYATATVFKAGSVIAIYDDTPDMNGAIKVESLVSDAIPAEDEDGQDFADDNTTNKDGGSSEAEDESKNKGPGSKKKKGSSETSNKTESSDKSGGGAGNC